MRIAVIGSGISGLASAYLLSRSYETHLYEGDNRIGGHSHTVDVMTAEGQVPVDTGFIVFNPLNYPNLVGMFDHLGVETETTDMSFGVSIGPGDCEYEGSLRGLLAQPSNLVRPAYWAMLRDLVRFYRSATVEVGQGPEGESLGQFIARLGYGDAFVQDHLLPMASAIWSCPAETMLAFPARSFIAFMNNHQLLNFIERPRWRTVTGGSRQYVRKIEEALGRNIHPETLIEGITRKAGGVALHIRGVGEVWYDRVVLAAHADQSLKLIDDPHPEESRILGAFDFQPNRVLLHSDTRLMPRRKSAWASWSYLTRRDPRDGLCVTYWMNRLQNIKVATPLLVSLNPFIEPDPALVHGEYFYDHPVFDQKAIDAQRLLPSLQGKNGLFYAGAWTRYGFHEDGLASAVAIARSLGVEIPWESPTAGYAIAKDMAEEKRPA
ncbi:NAD(P)/FAD-dependent oxidoreductase [Alphaproteobacteria bacterium LSUCC0684]